jgi:hypothetical protein
MKWTSGPHLWSGRLRDDRSDSLRLDFRNETRLGRDQRGADIQVPSIFRFIIQFITPVYLIGLLFFWGYQDGIPVLLMKGKPEADHLYLWGARLMMGGLTLVCLYLIARAYKRGMIRDEVAPDLR